MPKIRTKASMSKKENDPLDVTDEISIKEEKIDEIKKEVLDLDIVTDAQLEIKKEIDDFPNDNFLIDPKDIPGIEKIVNIEDILKNNFNSTDSTNLVSSKSANSVLKSSKTSVPKNSSVLKNNKSLCNCMLHIQHYCISCGLVTKYKAGINECSTCKGELKLQCSKCKRKYKILSQYLLQCSNRLKLLSNEKKTIVPKCEKQINFSCSICLFKTENKEKIDQHLKTHSIMTKIEQTDHSKIDKQVNADDEFIEMYCPKCFNTKKNLTFEIYVKNVTSFHEKYLCEKCHEVMLYRCVFCKKLYKSLNIRAHISSKCLKRIEYFKLRCDHCHFKTEDKSKLELHIRHMHTLETCEHCKREFVNSVAMKQHKTKGCPAEKSKQKSEMSKLPICKNESIYSIPLHEESSYQVVQYHPNELYNEIRSKPLKDLNRSSSCQSMIDYYCLLCDAHIDKKISKYRPYCRTCKTKYEYRCKFCEKLYSGYSNICNHVKDDCPDRYNLECSLCDFTSAKKKMLILHIKNKHTVFKCLQCESRYHGYVSLRRHLIYNCKIRSKKHLQKLIALYCKQCCKRIINFDGPSLKPCMRCTSTMSCECIKCNQLFDNLEMAHKHVKDECCPQFNCSKCNYNTYTQYDLDIHVKYAHTNNRKCSDCGVQFRDEEIFKMHRFEELRRKEEKKQILRNQEVKRLKLN